MNLPDVVTREEWLHRWLVDHTPVARVCAFDRRLELDDCLTQRVRDLVRQHHVPKQVQLAAHDGIAVVRSSPLDVREELRIGERVRVRELGLRAPPLIVLARIDL